MKAAAAGSGALHSTTEEKVPSLTSSSFAVPTSSPSVALTSSSSSSGEKGKDGGGKKDRSSSSSSSSSSAASGGGGGSLKKRLSIGYGFSSLRKRNPIKGVFEEEDKKKGKSIEIKVGDVGWKQTKHVGQEEGQQLKALMALAHQLGEEDTDDIVKLLDEWDKDKVQKEIEERKRIQMQKNRSLQVLMDRWNVQPHSTTSAPTSPADADRISPVQSTSTTDSVARDAGSPISGSSGDKKVTIVTSGMAEMVKREVERESKITRVKSEGEVSHHYLHHHRLEDNEEEEDDTYDDQYTGDSIIIDDDDEDLMEIPEIGSEGNESEGSEGKSPRTSFRDKSIKRLREPRPPSMVFGKKENLDLRDWQVFLDEERNRAVAPFASPRRLSSPRNSPRNSPAGFLIFKQKKKLGRNTASAQPTSKLSSESIDLMPSNRPKSTPESSSTWSDDDSDGRRISDADRQGGNEVIEPTEMSESEGDTMAEARRHRADSTLTSATSEKRSTAEARTPPVIPKIPIASRGQEEGIRLSPHRQLLRQSDEGTSPKVGKEKSKSSRKDLALSPKSRKEQLRRISLSDSQVVFFQRWMRETAKQEQDGAEEEKEPSKKEKPSYDKMDADALRKLIIKRDREIASLNRVIDELKQRDLKAQARERELREELKLERERAERMQQREAVLKDLIREKVEEQRKLREERDRNYKPAGNASPSDEDLLGSGSGSVINKQRRETHSGVISTNAGGTLKKGDKKEKKEKKEKKKGSFIKFQKESSKDRERSSRSKERKGSVVEAMLDSVASANSPRVGRSNTPEALEEELVQDVEGMKGGTWSKGRGREVKIFRHLRSKSSEEVPTAIVTKEKELSLNKSAHLANTKL